MGVAFAALSSPGLAWGVVSLFNSSLAPFVPDAQERELSAATTAIAPSAR